MKKDNADKISEEDQKTLDEAVEAAKKVVGDEKADKEALETAAKELNDKLMPIGSKLYEQASEAAPAEGEDAEKSEDKKDDAVEGEVVDDKDDKKKD